MILCELSLNIESHAEELSACCQIPRHNEIPKHFSCRFDCYIVKSKSVGIQLAYLYNGNYMWKAFHNFVLCRHLTDIAVNGLYYLSRGLILEEVFYKLKSVI